MKAIEARGIVTEDGNLIVPLPGDILPGEHEVIVVIKEETVKPSQKSRKAPLNLKVMSWNNWPPGTTFRREELYDDDGR